MFLSRASCRNLNRIHWDRRPWDIGYRGPLQAQQKATGRPDYPVTESRKNLLRERLNREWEVMRQLTRPYVTKEAELAYFQSKNVSSLEEQRTKEANLIEARRMPGKVKRTIGSKNEVRRRANVGNLLHEHSTVEQALASLNSRSRWF
ncbi:unnamed protein product, partial [Mesorhabditis belari]|uniref:Uncharacterized protein n=1 Tax=Mesorhabditis belari TaxID=2138241 RepID=A0AAF3E9L1_9BILA